MVLCACFEAGASESFSAECRDDVQQTPRKDGATDEKEIEINFNTVSGAHTVQVMGVPIHGREQIDAMPESVVIIEPKYKYKASREKQRYKCIRSSELNQTPPRPGRDQIKPNQIESTNDSAIHKARNRILAPRKEKKAPRRGRSQTVRT
mmetsp:Transcript_11238/g.17372  ORF Transcript_11238/g.17372 Transcript_11238/m.17372 type:complete len:150 (+) Transcript_11238:82-531(+)